MWVLWVNKATIFFTHGDRALDCQNCRLVGRVHLLMSLSSLRLLRSPLVWLLLLRTCVKEQAFEMPPSSWQR